MKTKKENSLLHKAATLGMAAVLLGSAGLYAVPQSPDTVLTVSAASTAAKSIKLNKTSLTLGKAETYTLKATVSPVSASKSVKWTTSDSKVVTVSNGKVTAKNTGTATITVKTTNGKTAKCKVTIKKAPTKITLNKTSITLNIKKTFTLKKTLPSGSASNKVTYTSSNKNIAAVNSAGKITAKKAGTATITAKTFNGKTAKCKVKVEDKNAAVLKVYKKVLSQSKISWESADYPSSTYSFNLADINNDGISELFLYSGRACHAEGYVGVGVVDNGKFKLIKCQDAITGYYPKSGIFVYQHTGMGFVIDSYTKFSNNNLNLFASTVQDYNPTYQNKPVVWTYQKGNTKISKSDFNKLLDSKLVKGDKLVKFDNKFYENTAANRNKYLK